MSKAKPPTEPAGAGQNRAVDDSERVPTDGRDWLFLLLSAGIAALLAIATSLVSTFAANTSRGVCDQRGMRSPRPAHIVPGLSPTARLDTRRCGR